MSMNAGFPGGFPLGNPGLNRELHQVPFDILPSKGVPYPDNIEILVAPVRIRERRQLEGATQATYYEKLLEGIQINGGQFDKTQLLFADVQFLDLVRRIHSFEYDKEIQIKGYTCRHCNEDCDVSFKFEEIEFSDFGADIFETIKKGTDDETGEPIEIRYPGKLYKFSDGLEVVVAPLTVGDYIALATKYMSNISEKNISNKMADVYIGQFDYLIKEVVGQTFISEDHKRKFIHDYICNLYKWVDTNLLEQIEETTAVSILPIQRNCPNCGENMEVYVNASMNFQQEV